jgi:hypothetical protein
MVAIRRGTRRDTSIHLPPKPDTLPTCLFPPVATTYGHAVFPGGETRVPWLMGGCG